jgi:hypothetical protein
VELIMARQKITPLHVLTHILVTPDTYRVMAGVLLGAVLMPNLIPEQTTVLGRYVLFIMLVCIGWALSAVPARWIARKLQEMVARD